MRNDTGTHEPRREAALGDQLRHALIEIRRLRTILDSRDRAVSAGPAAVPFSRSYWFGLGAMAGAALAVVLLA